MTFNFKLEKKSFNFLIYIIVYIIFLLKKKLYDSWQLNNFIFFQHERGSRLRRTIY